MAALLRPEVRPGIVAFFEGEAVRDHPDIAFEGGEVWKLRPFVCVERTGGTATFTPFSSRPKPWRPEIRPEWRTGGLPGWRTGPNYLYTPRLRATGPVAAWTALSAHEATGVLTRARVTRAGLAAIRAAYEEVASAGV